jgi:hypothetical protein
MTTNRSAQLEAIITQVADSYAAGRLIDSLGSAQLPSKRQVIEALGHLKATMYLGYYATGFARRRRSCHFAVGAHLYPAYDILVEQIRRAASYEGSARPACRATRAGPRRRPSASCRASRTSAPRCSRRTCSPRSRAIRPRTASRR